MAELPRRLGPGTATLVVVANTIGTGIFTTTGLMLAELASPALVLACWLVGGLVAPGGAPPLPPRLAQLLRRLLRAHRRVSRGRRGLPGRRRAAAAHLAGAESRGAGRGVDSHRGALPRRAPGRARAERAHRAEA